MISSSAVQKIFTAAATAAADVFKGRRVLLHQENKSIYLYFSGCRASNTLVDKCNSWRKSSSVPTDGSEYFLTQIGFTVWQKQKRTGLWACRRWAVLSRPRGGQRFSSPCSVGDQFSHLKPRAGWVWCKSSQLPHEVLFSVQWFRKSRPESTLLN